MSAVVAPPVSPFKGLAPFGDSELDALFFFGRERECSVIVANLLASRLTLLYGESGVGKSSLLAAGVARELRSVAPDAVVSLHDVWSGSLDGVFDDVREAKEAYLILDQFEEYFLYHGNALLDDLPELLRESRVNVLISLREDAVTRLDRFKAQVPSIFANQIRLEHLHRDAARSAMLGPVARWNDLTGDTVAVDPALVEAVLEEVAAGSVEERAHQQERIEAPYLQLVLERIWTRERAAGSSELRLQTLRDLGGAASIVRDHLQNALSTLAPPQQDLADELFQHLVTPSGSKIAHRAADLAEYAGVPEETLAGVLTTLVRDRIVHSVDGSDRYEIFHDVLVDPIQAWRLQRRLESERRAASIRQRRLLAVSVATAVALAIVAAIALFALAQRGHARAQARHARAGELAATALASLSRDPARSLQLALAAARLERTPRVTGVLRTALVQSRLQLVLPAGGAVTATSFDRASRKVIVGSVDGKAWVYDVETGRRLFALRVGGDGVTAASFSPDGRRVLVAGNGRALVRAVDGGPTLVLRHPGVRVAVFAADGRRIATGGSDGKVRLWRTGDGRLVRVIAPGGDVRHLAFAGTRLAAAWSAAGGVARAALFDTGDGRLIAALRGMTLEFDSGGTRLATGAQDRRARVYDADRGTLLSTLPHGGAVTSVDFSPNGEQLATASADGAVRVWNVRTGERVLLMPSGTATIETVRFSTDGRFIVTGGSDGVARVWNARNGRELITLGGHRDAVVDASFSRDGRFVVTGSVDGTARIWETRLAGQLRVLGRARSGFVRAGFTAGGTLAFAGGRDGALRVWRVDRRTPVVVLRGTAPLDDAAAAGGLAAAVDDHGIVRLWRLPSGRLVLELRVPAPGRRVAFSPDGRTLVAAGGRVAWLVDAQARRRVASVRLDGPVTDVRVADDGTFATATVGGAVAVWSRSGALVRRFADSSGAVVAVALSPDGRLVAAADREGVGRIWSVASGRLQHALGPAPKPLTDVEFSPDGRFVATAAIGGDARLWTVDHGRLVHVLRGHTGRVARLAFSPDGRWLITAGPTSVGLWDVATGGLLFYLRGHSAQVEDASFAPDNRHIVTASADGTVRTYACDVCGTVYALARLAHARLVHIAVDLTSRERKRYLGG